MFWGEKKKKKMIYIYISTKKKDKVFLCSWRKASGPAWQQNPFWLSYGLCLLTKYAIEVIFTACLFVLVSKVTCLECAGV